MKKPHRRFELIIKIGGNEWDDVLAQLDYLSYHIPDHGLNCNSVSGSPSSNHSVMIAEYPGMTEEIYFDQLNLYLAEKKEPKTCSDIGQS